MLADLLGITSLASRQSPHGSAISIGPVKGGVLLVTLGPCDQRLLPTVGLSARRVVTGGKHQREDGTSAVSFVYRSVKDECPVVQWRGSPPALLPH